MQFTAVAGAADTFVALTSANTLFSWGSGSSGRLGNGSSSDSAVPTMVDLSGIPVGVLPVGVAAGATSVSLLATDGRVYSWGAGGDGQIGNGASAAATSVPTPMSSGSPTLTLGSTQLSVTLGVPVTTRPASASFFPGIPAFTVSPSLPAGLVLDATSGIISGTATALSATKRYTVTARSGAFSATATIDLAVVTGGAFRAVAGGDASSFGLDASGNAYAWGANAQGQLGIGTTTDSATPVPVLRGAIPVGVSLVKIIPGNQHTVALGSDGNVYTWGSNLYGQLGLGDGASTAVQKAPVRASRGAIPEGVTIVDIAGSWWVTYALGSDGNIYAWGANNSGSRVGDGTTVNALAPVKVSTDKRVPGTVFTQVAAGRFSAVALGSDGTAYAWGANDNGANASGDTASHLVPTPIVRGQVPLGVVFVKITVGSGNAAAVGSDGRIYTWGLNGTAGRLGNNTTTDALAPVAVSWGAVAPGVTFDDVNALQDGFIARSRDGQLYAWGMGANGVIGNGSSADAIVPARVSNQMPGGVVPVALEGGSSTALVLASNGTVYAWGSNSNGQLGTGNASSVASTMAPVTMPTGVVMTAPGGTGGGAGLPAPWATARRSPQRRP